MSVSPFSILSAALDSARAQHSDSADITRAVLEPFGYPARLMGQTSVWSSAVMVDGARVDCVRVCYMGQRDGGRADLYVLPDRVEVSEGAPMATTALQALALELETRAADSAPELEDDTSEDPCTDHGFDVCPDCGNGGVKVGPDGYVPCTRFLTCWTDQPDPSQDPAMSGPGSDPDSPTDRPPAEDIRPILLDMGPLERRRIGDRSVTRSSASSGAGERWLIETGDPYADRWVFLDDAVSVLSPAPVPSDPERGHDARVCDCEECHPDQPDVQPEPETVDVTPNWASMRAFCRSVERTDPARARKIAAELGSEGLPYVDLLDVRDGLPSLTIQLDGKGLPSGAEMACAMALKSAGILPPRRVTVSVRSGALRLCPDDFRGPGGGSPGYHAVERALIDWRASQDDMTHDPSCRGIGAGGTTRDISRCALCRDANARTRG